MAAEQKGLDLQLLTEYFSASLTGENQDEILIEKYVLGFQEIAKFFEIMGTLFSFISKDIREKNRILLEHQKESRDHFNTVQSMVTYETANGLTKTKTSSGLLSGSRTLLRLHRSLLFFAKFLKEVAETDNDDAKCSEIANHAYTESLANFHPWLIRQAAYLAIRSLPLKKKLIDDYIVQSREEAEKMVLPLVECMQKVYDIVQQLYTEKSILDLP